MYSNTSVSTPHWEFLGVTIDEVLRRSNMQQLAHIVRTKRLKFTRQTLHLPEDRRASTATSWLPEEVREGLVVHQ